MYEAHKARVAVSVTTPMLVKNEDDIFAFPPMQISALNYADRSFDRRLGLETEARHSDLLFFLQPLAASL
jgi:hypothetical protein